MYCLALAANLFSLLAFVAVDSYWLSFQIQIGAKPGMVEGIGPPLVAHETFSIQL